MLLWGFNARPSLLLSISNCSVLLVLESKVLTFSKFRMEKIFIVQIFVSWSFVRNMRNFAPYETFPLYGMLFTVKTTVCVY